MPQSKANQEIFSAIDRYFDAERAKVEAGRDLAIGLLTWFESHAGELAGGVPVETTARSTPIPNDERDLTAQEPANIMAALQPAAPTRSETMSVYKRDKRGKRVKDNEPGTWCYDFTEEGVRYRKSLPRVKTKKEAKAVERHA
ncbi:MAG TPA: hypothetical protein VFY40_00570 [Blastocatellia bacterium]|nr:hypothetical protein [Blastocatellia bacterium]